MRIGSSRRRWTEQSRRRAAAIGKDKQALDVYPYLLRGLVLMGTMLGQAGDVNRASSVLAFAAQFYPRDAFSEFNLALTLGKQPRHRSKRSAARSSWIRSWLRPIRKLGRCSVFDRPASGRYRYLFRSGLQIDPLSAILYYDLGLALKQQGDSAARAKPLAWRPPRSRYRRSKRRSDNGFIGRPSPVELDRRALVV